MANGLVCLSDVQRQVQPSWIGLVWVGGDGGGRQMQQSGMYPHMPCIVTDVEATGSRLAYEKPVVRVSVYAYMHAYETVLLFAEWGMVPSSMLSSSTK